MREIGRLDEKERAGIENSRLAASVGGCERTRWQGEWQFVCVTEGRRMNAKVRV